MLNLTHKNISHVIYMVCACEFQIMLYWICSECVYVCVCVCPCVCICVYLLKIISICHVQREFLYACEYSSALNDTMYTSLSECIPENWYIDFLTSTNAQIA